MVGENPKAALVRGRIMNIENGPVFYLCGRTFPSISFQRGFDLGCVVNCQTFFASGFDGCRLTRVLSGQSST